MKERQELLRALDLKDAVGIGLGAIMGAGIFVVTGVAAGVAGPAFLLGLLIAGSVAAFNGLSSAQLASVYPQAGGTYEYGYRVLSPSLGFAAGWMFLLSKLSAAAVVALGFGSYLNAFFPQISPIYYSYTAIIVLAAANLFGIQKAGKLNLIIVAVTMISLLYFVFSGVTEVKTSNFTPFAPFGIRGIAEAAALLFFAFTGYARIATLGEEVKNPEVTIPKAVIITIVAAIILYSFVAFTAVGVIGSEALSETKSPLNAVALNLKTPGIVQIIGIGACTAMLGVLLSQILGISRMMFAMGRRSDLPRSLSTVSKTYKVPAVGIVTTALIILLLTFLGNFEFIVRAATFSILVYYSITNLAALQQPDHEQRFGKTVAVAGLAGCLLMAFSLPAENIVTGTALLLSGFVLRFIWKKFS